VRRARSARKREMKALLSLLLANGWWRPEEAWLAQRDV
jgi:hypothetical protein